MTARTRQKHHGVATLIATMVVTLLSWALLAGAEARAHAFLVGSTPADGAVLGSSPEEIRLEFNEPVQPPDRALRVSSESTGTLELSVGVGDDPTHLVATLADELPQDRYELHWRALSLDGHLVEGTLALTIEPAGPDQGAPDDDGSSGRHAADAGGTDGADVTGEDGRASVHASSDQDQVEHTAATGETGGRLAAALIVVATAALVALALLRSRHRRRLGRASDAHDPDPVPEAQR